MQTVKEGEFLTTLVLLTWDWEFLNMPILYSCCPIQPSYFWLLFSFSDFLLKFPAFWVFLGHSDVRCIIQSRSLSEQHPTTSEVCWEPEPRQMYFPSIMLTDGCNFTCDTSVRAVSAAAGPSPFIFTLCCNNPLGLILLENFLGGQGERKVEACLYFPLSLFLAASLLLWRFAFRSNLTEDALE